MTFSAAYIPMMSRSRVANLARIDRHRGNLHLTDCTAIIELTVRGFCGVPEVREGIAIVEANGEQVQHRHAQGS